MRTPSWPSADGPKRISRSWVSSGLSAGMMLRHRRSCSPSIALPQPASSGASAAATTTSGSARRVRARAGARRRHAAGAPLMRLLEIFQVGRLLALLGGHQAAVGAQEIVLLADDQLVVAFRAIGFGPVRVRILVAPKGLVHAPGPGQGVIEHGDLVMQDIRIGLVEMEPF